MRFCAVQLGEGTRRRMSFNPKGAQSRGMPKHLTGRYQLKNRLRLLEKASRVDDPRHEFYAAILENNTYEGYLAQVGEKEVKVKTCKNGPISGRMEIRYAYKNGWIKDAE